MKPIQIIPIEADAKLAVLIVDEEHNRKQYRVYALALVAKETIKRTGQTNTYTATEHLILPVIIKDGKLQPTAEGTVFRD